MSSSSPPQALIGSAGHALAALGCPAGLCPPAGQPTGYSRWRKLLSGLRIALGAACDALALAAPLRSEAPLRLGEATWAHQRCAGGQPLAARDGSGWCC